MKALFVFSLLLIYSVAFSQSIVFNKVGMSTRVMVNGDQIFWFDRGSSTANKQNNSTITLFRGSLNVGSYTYSKYVWNLDGYTPSTIDSVVYVINTQFFNDSTTVDTITTKPLGVTYTRRDTTYTSTGSPHTIASGRSSVLMLFGSGFAGSVNGLTIPANSTSWSDVIDQPGGVLPAITLTITSDTVRVFSKIKQ